ncbi:MAG: adenosine kinase [Spirochaetales bacterium]|nr:adenosine kinase [Spirochaetales bacterium]
MKLACVGNALYDIVSFVETDFASSLGFHAGSTAHISYEEIKPVLARLPGKSFRSAGGGAMNTARVYASLGYEAAFAGMVGADETGNAFHADASAFGVETFLQACDEPTGIFCALITPDGDRTIIVAPGAAPFLDATAIPATFFAKDAVLYIDGFLSTNPKTVFTLVSRANEAGMRIALDVAGYRLASKHRDEFVTLIREHCAWTFMNEDEFIALAGAGVDEALEEFSLRVPGIVVVKRAEIGAVCVSNGSIVESAVRPIRATDPTGAGDAFAAGFLSAALAGAPLARCLRLGNRVAEQAIQVPGMAIDRTGLRKAAAAIL